MEPMIYYITSNKDKVEDARKFLDKWNIEIEGGSFDFIEPQSDSIEVVARSKAEQAFEQIKMPLFVNDSGWEIPSLNGFPGPLMKYINEWLTVEDLLNLMRGKESREIILEEAVVYKDLKETKVFTHRLKGVILEEAKGEGIPSDRIISLGQNGKSISECKALGIKAVEDAPIWDEFGNWLRVREF